ncbi:hypothetical protein GCM10028820_21010 [Tessaracoccus terricola]
MRVAECQLGDADLSWTHVTIKTPTQGQMWGTPHIRSGQGPGNMAQMQNRAVPSFLGNRPILL